MPSAPERLTTARLTGGPIAEGDRAFYRAIWQDPDVVRSLGGPRSRAQIDARLERQMTAWRADGFGVYTLRRRGEPCGYAGLAPTDAAGRPSVEVLYGFLPAVWRLGLATEAARALVRLALGELALPEVCGFTWAENLGSRRVLERAGLSHLLDFERADLPHRYYLRRAAEGPPLAPARRRCVLSVLAARGPRALAVGHEIAFAVDEVQSVLLGRVEHAEIHVPDPAVARAACRIRLADGQLLLTDTGDAGSVRINHGPAWPDDQPIGDGDLLYAGAHCLRLTVLDLA